MSSKIREGLEQILINSCEQCVKARFADARDASIFLSPLTDQVISYLKSQNVARRVDRELPVSPWSGKATDENVGHAQGIYQMLKAGYVAVEELE